MVSPQKVFTYPFYHAKSPFVINFAIATAINDNTNKILR